MVVVLLGQAALVWRGEWPVDDDEALVEVYGFLFRLRSLPPEQCLFPVGREVTVTIHGQPEASVLLLRITDDEIWVPWIG